MKPEDVGRQATNGDPVHRHLHQRVEELERLALAHAKRALAAEELADLLAGEIRHVVEEGCENGCLARALGVYDDAQRNGGGKDRREVTVRLAEGEARPLRRKAATTPKRPMPGDVSPGPAAQFDGDESG